MSQPPTISRKTKAVLSLTGLFLYAALMTNPMMTDENGARDTLKAAGLTPTEVGGYSWFGCGQGDVWKTRFKATNAQGVPTAGIVCKGLFKGTTIRYE